MLAPEKISETLQLNKQDVLKYLNVKLGMSVTKKWTNDHLPNSHSLSPHLEGGFQDALNAC